MKKTMLLAGLAAAMLAGCDNKPAIPPMPEVNDTNCQIEAIKKIEDRATRETFAGLCSRRSPAGGGIAPTERPMNWLELADPKGSKGQEVKP
ncbi:MULTISPECIES: entry exclusion lipoprotein TrbK [Pseudomonadota]|jgi:entry exclusion lipoprotein TrbK|uniref:entry exclusion lipoprotein TrbK n=1 Tax=Pseudomonadota TaxID=1224 RepID=UPI00053D9D2D|nr:MULTISPECIES: entry exclusion lipoprotein TrbK [Pseudomonadota]HCU1948882.1 entry exclusion lipoprotein TrbK [Pseudomonas aeruginosa]HCU1980882.1 entry exclusion lipoprotein TrbK [Pseudomonas aeruginosa]